MTDLGPIGIVFPLGLVILGLLIGTPIVAFIQYITSKGSKSSDAGVICVFFVLLDAIIAFAALSQW